MTTEPATIDLGVVELGHPPPEPRWPTGVQLPRWAGRRTRRGLAVAAVTGLLLATVTLAQPARPPLVHVFTVPVENVAFDEHHLYAVEDSGNEAGATLVAYRLADGAVRWEAPLPDGSHEDWPMVQSGTVVAVSYYGENFGGTVTAFAAESGAHRWSHVGRPMAAGSGRLLLDRPFGGVPDDLDGGPRWELVAVDLLTGEVAWTRALPGDLALDTTDSARLVALEANGDLTSHDLVSGGVRARAPSISAGETSLRIVGSLVFVVDMMPSQPSLVAAYDVDDLSLRWTLTNLRTVAGDEDRGYYDAVRPAPCGSLVCLHGPDLPPRAVDPATGETVWSAGWVPRFGGDGWYSISQPDHPRLAGYVMLEGSSGEGDYQNRWLVDARTGEQVLDLQRWWLAPAGGAAANGPPDPVVIWQDGGGPSWLGRLRPDLSGVDVLGMIDRPPVHQCALPGRYVVCRSWPLEDPDEQDTEWQPQVEVWRAWW